MSDFISVIIILLAMVIQAFLQLTPGVFACFYHHALGKTSVKKADDASLSFILGTEIFTAIAFLTIYIIISFIAADKITDNNIYTAILAGVFIAEAVITLFFYFRRNTKKKEQSTRLFLPRHITKSLIRNANKVKNRSDTITLGIITATLELFFTLPLYIIISTEILNLSLRYGFVYIIAYIIIATIPLFAIRTAFRTDHNLAEIQRFRVSKKSLIRLILSLSYLLIAILIIVKGWL
ncbi:hypothetical protein IJG93_01930 [Candidatus Saccharibacteria bacterium]|nr:hypothetical protein [Candidatus Saccharibacteria bacterium]